MDILRTMFTLNIGLNRPDGGTNTREAVTQALANAWPTSRGVHAPVKEYGPFNSETEPTIVATVGQWGAADRATVHALAVALGQEAIAVLDRQFGGELIGPEAAKWGDFNPQFFIMPDGRTLNTHLQRVNQG